MRILFFLFTVILSSVCFGQKKEVGKAISTDGRRIILYDDGTWRYEIEPVPVKRGTAIPDTSENLYNKPIGGNYQKSPYNKKVWQSNRTNFTVWFNPKKWKLNLMNLVPPTEVSFHFIDITCNVLSEKIDIDMEEWIHSMKQYQKQNHPSLKIELEEWRSVNGLNVYYIKWQTNDRLNFQCYTYFSKSSSEVIQMNVSGPLSFARDSEEEIFRLLNGLVLDDK